MSSGTPASANARRALTSRLQASLLASVDPEAASDPMLMTPTGAPAALEDEEAPEVTIAKGSPAALDDG